MANSCNKLMKDAIEVAGQEFKGIELNYKLDEVLGNLKPSMKFTAEQLKGYLLKQGVSPNEIKASKMFEGFETDNRVLPISDWNNLGGRQVIGKRESSGYEDITLGQKGLDESSNYKVNEFLSAKPELPTNLRHQFNGSYSDKLTLRDTIDPIYNLGKEASDIRKAYKEKGISIQELMANPEKYPDYHNSLKQAKAQKYKAKLQEQTKATQLGWNRVHQDTINGKPTTVLNELQSDWMQAERQGAGIFESKYEEQKNRFLNELNLTEKDFNELDPSELYNLARNREQEDFFMQLARKNKIADFPLKPEKFQQLMIVDALNEAIENGTNRVAIPTVRHGNELVGTEGVTKFYQDLNKKVLPDIRKKLEKQGIRVKVSSEDYNGKQIPGSFTLEASDTFIDRNFANLSNTDIINIENYLRNNEVDYLSEDLLRQVNIALDLQSNNKNKLHILEIEEVPNTKVKWDVYGLLSSIGLGAYAINSEANTTLESSIIANKRPIETNKMSEPIVEEDKPIIMQERPIEINPDDYRDTVGGIKGYIANIESRQAEGIAKYNLKNPNSSALGKYQFTDDMRKQLFKDLKMTPKDLKSPDKQEEAMTYLIGVYKDRLEKWDLPVNKENMFIVHNLGTTGGIRALRGTYTDTDILNMRGNLPEYLAQSNPYEVVKNYSMYYNVDIPITRTLKSMENLPPKNTKK